MEFSDTDTPTEIEVRNFENLECWTVPHSVNTNYLTHGYIRYIGKFPPQIASKIIDDYYPGNGIILDPMVGGGTVLTEAVIRGIECEGWDINPYSLLASKCVSRRVSSKKLLESGELLIQGLSNLNNRNSTLFSENNKWKSKGLKLNYCSEYFDEKALEEIEFALHIIKIVESEDEKVAELLKMIILSCLRKISFANVKKMNIELDLEKKTKKSLFEEFSSKFKKINKINQNLPSVFSNNLSSVFEKNAMSWNTEKKYSMIIIHPPYLSNTAFSESTMLQLAILDIDHKSIWKKELRCRGSFLHEPNGLKKYLINWANIIKSASESLDEDGILAVIVGDGQVEKVRIPIGIISIEFGKDYGLQFMKHSLHILNNNTGQTQNKKMSGQHVIIFKK